MRIGFLNDIQARPLHGGSRGHRRHGRARRAAGFTLIEIVVAIGILVLLIGISVAAIGRIARHNKNHQTQASMETLKLMLQNYIAATNDDSCSQLNGAYGDIVTTTSGIPAPPTPNGNYQVSPTTGANGAVYPSVGSGIIIPPPATGQQKPSVVFRTYMVMQRLYAVPANRPLFDKVPPEQRFYLTQIGSTVHLADPFLLADGFGEPILYVPPVGLGNVGNTVGGSTANVTWTGTMQSDGRLRDLSKPVGTAPNVGSATPALGNPNNASPRPFFASAGADHDFTKGDDNVYSFEQH